MSHSRPQPRLLIPALVVLSAALSTFCRHMKPGEATQKDPAGTEESESPSAEAAEAPPEAGQDPFASRSGEHLDRVPDPAIVRPDGAGAGVSLDNSTFRDRVISFVRQVSAGGEEVQCALPLASAGPFHAVVSAYRQGEQIARGEAADADLCVALKDAARRAVAAAGGDGEALEGARLAVELPDHNESMIEFEGKGLELSRGVIVARRLDRDLIERRIEEGKEYLLRILDPAQSGAHKVYYAPTDSFAPELHTIYTASTALTLLKLHARTGDESVLERALDASDFMLDMQSHDERELTAGGFFYSFDLKRQKPLPRLAVGTTSKSVFTLLELHAVTREQRYLDAAVLAADWLISMQRPNGAANAYLSRNGEVPYRVHRSESMLYTGQLLSALSRVYRATKNPRYVDAAARTARHLLDRVSHHGCYLGDEYRKPNPVSSSWVVLSLLDFTRATGDARVEQTVLRCAQELVRRQWRNPGELSRHGRWPGSLSSSGTGWLAEVMSEVYGYCREQGMNDCAPYKDAVVAAIRLIMQSTYTPESSFMLKNPEAAQGGVFWSAADRYVRTDSVCHAMNAYLNIIDHLGEGPLVVLPEQPLSERLSLPAESDPPGDGAGPSDDERDEAWVSVTPEPPASKSDDPHG
jgi:rhamnogalacturonyl hydrolase YesR